MSLVAMATTAQEKTAYAVLCKDICTLYFLNSSETLTEGELYKGISITKLWSGEQVTNTGNTSIDEPGWITYIRENHIDINDVVIDGDFKDVKPKSLAAWFRELSNLSSIKGLEYLNTSEATNMSSMFQYCRHLTELDLSSFDTGKVENMTNMFLNCTSLKKLDLSSFNTSNVWIMSSMFSGCEALTELDLRSFDTKKVTHMASMFAHCSALTYIDKRDDFGVNATNTTNMYLGCNPLLQGSTPYVVYNDADRSLHFLCDAAADLTAITLADGTEITLTNKNSWKGNAVVNIVGNNQVPGWWSKKSDVSSVVFEESFKFARPTNCYGWFAIFSSLTTITGLDNLYTSKVTNMTSMFYDCSALTALDLSNFTTTAVTDMSTMFSGCTAMTDLDLSSFTTPAVTNINSMFNGCSALETITFGEKFTTEKVKYMSYVFSGCSALTKLDLSSFTTPAEASMNSMFSGCTALTDLDIRNVEISSTISDGIVKCNNLMKLNMSNATGDVTLLAGNEAFDGRGMMISVPDGFDLANVSTENYIVKTTGTSFARTFTADNMSTICLPFAVDATAIAEQGTLYKYVDIVDNAVKFTSVAGSTTPGEAYLFKPATSEKVIFTCEEAMTDFPADITEGTEAGLYGTYTGKVFGDEADLGIYFGWANGSFWRAGENAEVKHNRAYLKTAAGTTPARLSVKLGDETTGISEVSTTADDDAPAYDLMGRRVGAGYKGIVIKNGKKGLHPASQK